MDRTKPIYFRPSSVDTEILDLIASNHPVSRDSPTELIRRALEEYLIAHSPGRGKTDRLEAIERELSQVKSLIAELVKRLNQYEGD